MEIVLRAVETYGVNCSKGEGGEKGLHARRIRGTVWNVRPSQFYKKDVETITPKKRGPEHTHLFCKGLMRLGTEGRGACARELPPTRTLSNDDVGERILEHNLVAAISVPDPGKRGNSPRPLRIRKLNRTQPSLMDYIQKREESPGTKKEKKQKRVEMGGDNS